MTTPTAYRTPARVLPRPTFSTTAGDMCLLDTHVRVLEFARRRAFKRHVRQLVTLQAELTTGLTLGLRGRGWAYWVIQDWR